MLVFMVIIIIRIIMKETVTLYKYNSGHLLCFYCPYICFLFFRADKIPVAQYSSYVESCQKERQKDCGYSLLH